MSADHAAVELPVRRVERDAQEEPTAFDDRGSHADQVNPRKRFDAGRVAPQRDRYSHLKVAVASPPYGWRTDLSAPLVFETQRLGI